MIMNTKKEIRYSYDWTWMGLFCIWLGLEGYWAGIILENQMPISISLGMLCLSVGLALSFLLAFQNSKKEIQE